MLYVEYEIYKSKYYNAQKNYNDILNEKEKLFNKTQPGAVNYDKEVVSGGVPVNSFDEYVIKKDKKQIDERLEEAMQILKDRELLLKLKEEELFLSKDVYDVIYTYSYIHKKSVKYICSKVSYGKSQVYRILNEIKRNIKVGKKSEK